MLSRLIKRRTLPNARRRTATRAPTSSAPSPEPRFGVAPSWCPRVLTLVPSLLLGLELEIDRALGCALDFALALELALELELALALALALELELELELELALALELELELELGICVLDSRSSAVRNFARRSAQLTCTFENRVSTLCRSSSHWLRQA
ncbi:MAG: hypothetical protein AMXMBFR33_29520 [Candidatus Xenobia bacterium]